MWSGGFSQEEVKLKNLILLGSMLAGPGQQTFLDTAQRLFVTVAEKVRPFTCTSPPQSQVPQIIHEHIRDPFSSLPTTVVMPAIHIIQTAHNPEIYKPPIQHHRPTTGSPANHAPHFPGSTPTDVSLTPTSGHALVLSTAAPCI